jgi:hypothetical protein
MRPGRFPRLRFSLRTALLATTVLCIWLGWQLQAAKRQKQAVERIRAAGGWVAYDYAWKDGDWIQGGKSPVPQWLTSIAGEDAFHSVVAVDLAALFHSAYDGNRPYMGPDPDAAISDELWQSIEQLRSTQWLSLNARNFSDNELRHVRGLSRLTELKMEAAPIDGAGLEHLVSLPNLEHLNLSRIHLKDEHAHWLAQMKQVRVLGLSESTISPAVAADLQQKMPWCKQYYEHWPPPPPPATRPWIGIRIVPPSGETEAPAANDQPESSPSPTDEAACTKDHPSARLD